MNALPPIVDHDERDALVVRTDYGDEEAWQAVVNALGEPWGDGELKSFVHFVDDPIWAGASVDQVLAAVAAEESLGVVFIADQVTMQAEHHALLAVNAFTREELGDECYEETVEFGREFRTAPIGVQDVYANVHVANLGFEEYAEGARDYPEGVYRSF